MGNLVFLSLELNKTSIENTSDMLFREVAGTTAIPNLASDACFL